MSTEKKINAIKENKDAAIAALNSYLDTLYGMTDQYFDENGDLKEGLERDEKVESLIKSMREDAKKYESIRRKLMDSDFNLSLVEIAYVGLSFVFAGTAMEKQIKNLTLAQKSIKSIIEVLMEGETQNVDFS